MFLAIQIALGLFSGVIFFTLLHRAFFSGKAAIVGNWFGRVDITVALSISIMFAWLAIGLFDSPERAFTEKDIVGSIITQAIFGGAVVAYVLFRKIPLAEFFGTAELPIWKSLGWGFLLMLGIFPCVGVIANLLNSDASQEQEAVKFFQGTTSLHARLLLAFMAVIVAPVVEEMVFRGLLYRIFRGYFGKIAAMFFTSVLFASIHGNLPTLLPLTLLAFALTAGLELSGSLLVNIAMHATFNAISLALMLFEKTS